MTKKNHPVDNLRKRLLFPSILAVMVLLLSQVRVYANGASITVQLSTPLTRGEDLDYMFREWHDRWDMNEPSDLYEYASTTCPPAIPAEFNPSTIANGVWSGTYQNDGPGVWLIYPGYNALHIGKDGNVHPVDATYFTQLTFRMYVGGQTSGSPGATVLWTKDNLETLNATGAAGWGSSKFFRIFPGWNIYTIDLTKIGFQQGGLNWGGLITGLKLNTGLRLASPNAWITDVKLDWVRLTPKPMNQVVTWSGSWTGANASLLFSVDGTTYDPLRIYTNNEIVKNIVDQDPIPAGTGLGNANIPASFPPGDVYAEIQIDQTTSNSAEPWRFQAHPMVTITRPSYNSGDDFATSVVGNPWDMNGPTDISSYDQIASTLVFSANILTTNSVGVSGPGKCGPPWGDPKLNLNLGGKTINPKLFRYLTVNLKVNAPFDFGNGWVSRLYWFKTDGTWGGSNDMPLYTGWNKIQVDMWGNVNDNQVPGTATWFTGAAPINQLRFDPFEIPIGTQFELGEIKLTANDRVNRGQPFTIQYHFDNQQSGAITVYYDTDRNRANGRVPALQYSSTYTHTQGHRFTYLPLINTSSSSGNTSTYMWDTTNVPPGDYYISIDDNDGYDTVTWYSETSLIVQ